MEFYQAIFGGELTINTFREYHVSQVPADDDKIMHPSMLESEIVTIMAADLPNSIRYLAELNFSLSLFAENEVKLRSFFEKLSAGG